ncbi:MAG: hypothetical protein GXP24_03545 [Planctomycetes bacterium]|nr:hypothetical protein [Planctomycetota bacterium]
MLSANAGLMPALELPSQSGSDVAVVRSVVDNGLGARDQALAISAIHVLIDGREVTLTSLDRPLEMKVGSSLQIVGIDYLLSGEETVSGKIAFEGYLNKLRGKRIRTDYSDGRFGGHVQEGELPFGASLHPGLDGEWKMEAGTESLTIVMVRYDADGATVEDRVTVRTQVGTPDFVIDPEIRIKGSNKGVVVGKRVKIYGAWGNQGEGRYRNYAEVDIYHESDPNKIVWSGTIADVVDAGDFDKGQFVNKVKRDGFAKRWVPELGGTYTLKFYADPENSWNESNEDNNVVEVKLEVKDLRRTDRGRDASRGFGVNPHSANDSDIYDAALALVASGLNHPAKITEVDTPALDNTGGQVAKTAAAPFSKSLSLAVQRVVADEATEWLGEKSSEVRGETTSEDAWFEAIDLALSMPVI